MSAPLWIPKSDRMPAENERIVAGSYRKGKWSMSSVSDQGWAWWIDSDRTHWFALPLPPSPPPPAERTQP